MPADLSAEIKITDELRTLARKIREFDEALHARRAGVTGALDEIKRAQDASHGCMNALLSDPSAKNARSAIEASALSDAAARIGAGMSVAVQNEADFARGLLRSRPDISAAAKKLCESISNQLNGPLKFSEARDSEISREVESEENIVSGRPPTHGTRPRRGHCQRPVTARPTPSRAVGDSGGRRMNVTIDSRIDLATLTICGAKILTIGPMKLGGIVDAVSLQQVLLCCQVTGYGVPVIHSHEPTRLLDYIGVAQNFRIEGESILGDVALFPWNPEAADVLKLSAVLSDHVGFSPTVVSPPDGSEELRARAVLNVAICLEPRSHRGLFPNL